MLSSQQFFAAEGEAAGEPAAEETAAEPAAAEPAAEEEPAAAKPAAEETAAAAEPESALFCIFRLATCVAYSTRTRAHMCKPTATISVVATFTHQFVLVRNVAAYLSTTDRRRGFAHVCTRACGISDAGC